MPVAPPVHRPIRRPPEPRQTGHHGFYTSTGWRRLRLVKLASQPLCEACECAGTITPATQVHHIEDVANRPELSMSMENLSSLCQTCHSKITRARMR